MDAPPPPTLTAIATAVVTPSSHTDSVSSSPRSRQTDTEPPQKLRLMCSYGGHIIPRPHDKSLCYIGGDTRIIVIDRQTSLFDLHHRLSKTLRHDQPFSLKYQIPNEDLDALISVTTDEDLENMVEEYDRLNNNNNNAVGGLKPGRLRLFLFPKSSSTEQVLVDAASIKSEDWFLNALNGGKAATFSVTAANNNFSSVNCLLGLDDAGVVKSVESQIEGTKSSDNANRNNNINQDVHSVPGTPMLETSSSFGSTCSSPSISNLPPIRVRVGELGNDENFQQMRVGGNLTLPRQKAEVGALVGESVVADAVVVVGGDYANPVISDDERSDHGGYNRAPQVLQQQIPQFQQKQAVANDLASPDSISSEGSATNPLSRQRQAIYQEAIVQIQAGSNRVSTNPADVKILDQNNSMVKLQSQVQESGYVLSSQSDQSHPHLQQVVHAGVQYIPAGVVPIMSYYSMYPSQQQHHPHQSMLDQQCPVYFMPATQAQTCNLPIQPQNYSELKPTAGSSQPLMPPASYNQAAGVYRTTRALPLSQVPSNQHQSQFVGFSQINHPSQSVGPAPVANSSHACEFTDPANAQMYCSQPFPPQFVAQYQTLTSAPAGVLPEVSAQLPAENIKNQAGTSQP